MMPPHHQRFVWDYRESVPKKDVSMKRTPTQQKLIAESKDALLRFITAQHNVTWHEINNAFKTKGRRYDALLAALGDLVYTGAIETFGEDEQTVLYSIPQQ
jgi:hypothetical protein